MKENRSTGMNGNWFWQSSTAAWIEGKLISLTNWFWNKRHPPTTKQRTASQSNEISKENTTKKSTAKKSPAKKKSSWSVKE